MPLHKDSDVCHLNFCSPIVLNKLQKVNNSIADFFGQTIKGDAAKSEWLQKIYKRIVLMKAQHDFRWYMLSADHALSHAAIAPYVDNPPNILDFKIIARNLRQYNSYEGIGELRLGEKIIYEYSLIKKNLKSEFTVAIMGDLHAGPLEELYDYVDKKIEKPVCVQSLF